MPEDADDIDIVELARQRFDYDPALEQRKMKELTKRHNINEDDLLGPMPWSKPSTGIVLNSANRLNTGNGPGPS